MKTITYYPTIFHTNPFAYKMSDIWELSEYNAKDLLLNNKMATERGVTEMILNITDFSAVDEAGNEHNIKDFDNSSRVNVKGTHTGLFLKTNGPVDLKPGRYSKLRFHLGSSGNTLILKDGTEQKLQGRKYLDFEIRNGLLIDGDDHKPFVLRFDLEPYSLASLFNPIRKLFKRPKRSVGKLVNGFAQ